MPLFDFGGKGKTFKPVKSHSKEKSRGLSAYASATLGTGDVRAAVRLPEGEDESEWIATHTVDFFNVVSLLFGTVLDFCTPETCPTMSAGPKYEYLWGESVPKPVRVPAREYVDLLLTWVDGLLSNESIFPSSVDVPFPKTFKSTVKQIFKRLFRVYAHIYYSHFQQVQELGAEAHCNSSFKHFITFASTFDLIDAKETAPLQELVDRYLGTGAPAGGAGGK